MSTDVGSLSSKASTFGEHLFSLEEIHRFIKDCMMAVNTSENHAKVFAACLTEADYKGHYCEGLNKLETYINEIQQGGCNPNADPEILKESPVTAWVNGQNGLGVVVSHFCMDLAIKKAKDSGIGWVVAKGSNSFGIAGIYSVKALEEGLLGMSFTNGSPMVAPTRAMEGALGTNPISVAAPALDGDSFVLDMATAAVAVGKIEILSRKNLPVPTDWANPKTGAMRPLGGHEPNSNYKGFGLGFFVEVICGILAGSAYGPNIRKYGDLGQIANLGQCFVALNPTYFAPGFEERLTDLLNFIRNMQPADPEKPVMVPGDREREHMATVDQEGGIHYCRDLVESCNNLAESLNVVPLSPLR
ncbi:uncharacterized oxidoreductase YjmC isoform X1 [Tribolium castaneum]|uniref:Malate dehydrogenase-like Protein n=1 Tax=Tribolium castaneum TaxID=7070 RepID=A0A139WEH9_TRICA|nr:PREDICTED: uncharacterized oxidoreductase YjmC-like isoform X1 [Tribolium castaneum]KYB26267.1 Malate dehydrogenase-like Protein [Tribolium castaneum]|eukprot:XP_967269.1 PREDICTED: uncharacterized oxidoreductase YjmC-like isoform X1 [Tribolium castaneum]